MRVTAGAGQGSSRAPSPSRSRRRLEPPPETKARAARLPKGLRGLWHRITGQYQKVRAQNEAEAKASRKRQAHERQQLIDRQREERARLQAEFKSLRKRQAEELLELRRELGRFFKFSRGLEPGPARKREMSIGLGLER